MGWSLLRRAFPSNSARCCEVNYLQRIHKDPLPSNTQYLGMPYRGPIRKSSMTRQQAATATYGVPIASHNTKFSNLTLHLKMPALASHSPASPSIPSSSPVARSHPQSSPTSPSLINLWAYSVSHSSFVLGFAFCVRTHPTGGVACRRCRIDHEILRYCAASTVSLLRSKI